MHFPSDCIAQSGGIVLCNRLLPRTQRESIPEGSGLIEDVRRYPDLKLPVVRHRAVTVRALLTDQAACNGIPYPLMPLILSTIQSQDVSNPED